MTTQYSKDALESALTAYDARQSKKRGYNPYALAQYLMRADEVDSDIKAGADPRQAICAAFDGRLLDAALKPFGWKATDDEVRGSGRITYQPVAKR